MLRVLARAHTFTSRQVIDKSSSSASNLTSPSSNLSIVRTFSWGFNWGSGGGNSGDGKAGGGNNNNNNSSSASAASASSSSSPNSNDDDDNNNNDDNDEKITSNPSNLPSPPPTLDNAPTPHSIYPLGLSKRPVFPGVISSLRLTDKKVIKELEEIMSKDSLRGVNNRVGGATNTYIGLFLRHDCTVSNDDGDESESIATRIKSFHGSPEVVSKPLIELHKTGVLAQIHSLQRLNTNNKRLALTSGTAATSSSGNDVEDKDKEDDKIEANLLVISHRRIDLTDKVPLSKVGDKIVKKSAANSKLTPIIHWGANKYDPENVTSKSEKQMLTALTNELVMLLRELVQSNPLLRESVSHFLAGSYLTGSKDGNKTAASGSFLNDENSAGLSDPYKLCDFTTSLLSSPTNSKLQAILEEKSAIERMNLTISLLNSEVEITRLQEKIRAKIDEEMEGEGRKRMLREQIKVIKKELGETVDERVELVANFRKLLKDIQKIKPIPKDTLKIINREISKLESLDVQSGEFNVTKSYLEVLTSLPWGTSSKENYDLRTCKLELDSEHYGMDDVKDYVLQVVASQNLNPQKSGNGKILCLSGPPGVGKTSIGKSIAKSLGREFERFSVGGLSDASEIKGHRRTYVGAMPGKIIQGLRRSGTNNPVIMIDEIDKLSQGRGVGGDPASALLELLDPSQNQTFVDHYLDVPVDMSNALFIATANNLENIPQPLLDRMEVIRLSGYDVPEKIAIAEEYLVTKAMMEAGLVVKEILKEEESGEGEKGEKVAEPDPTEPPVNLPKSIALPPNIGIDHSAIESLVRWYCRESGVRNLEKHIQKICRKLALRVVASSVDMSLGEKESKKHEGWMVTADNLEEYVGKPVWTSDRLYENEPPHGVVMGLAWTSMGGAALYIESQVVVKGSVESSKGGSIKMTGQMGDVMKESVTIATTNARRHLSKYQGGNSFFDDYDVHMHIPAGATPKDGPSAGITMITSLLSLALDRPIRADLAMTGEVSLTGKVLPIGGVKEKTIAARRAGVNCLIFPMDNKRDFEELPAYLKEGIEVHFVSEYQQVFEVAFMEEDFFTNE